MISALACDVVAGAGAAVSSVASCAEGIGDSDDAAVDCFQALPPLWLQWLWCCARDKGDGEFSGAIGCNLKLFLKRERLRLGERGEFGFSFGLKSETVI